MTERTLQPVAFRSIDQLIRGPARAVPVLGLSQILGWGAIFYPVVLMAPLIAADHGWSTPFAIGGFSVGLLVQGIVSRRVGALIDRYGGHVVMAVGSLLGAAGLLALTYANSAPAYLAVWAFLGIAARFSRWSYRSRAGEPRMAS